MTMLGKVPFVTRYTGFTAFLHRKATAYGARHEGRVIPLKVNGIRYWPGGKRRVLMGGSAEMINCVSTAAIDTGVGYGCLGWSFFPPFRLPV